MKKESSGKQYQYMRVDLKYCERCGCLWLRADGSEGTYCAACVPEIEQLPAPKKRPTSVRLPRRGPMVGDFEFEIDDSDFGDQDSGGMESVSGGRR